jgi:hypothetical protein
VAADGDAGADLEVGPAEFGLDLLVGLPYPMAHPVDLYDLGRVHGQQGFPPPRVPVQQVEPFVLRTRPRMRGLWGTVRSLEIVPYDCSRMLPFFLGR